MAVLLGGCGQAAASSIGGLRLSHDLALPGDTSRYDYQSLDPIHHRLYIAHLGAGTVTVIDTQHDTVIGDISDVPGVHGVLSVPALNRVYATATDRNELAVIDPATMRVVTTVPAGDYPDGIAFDPVTRRLFVSDEQGATVTVVDAATNRRTGTVAMGGEVGNVADDAARRALVVAVQSTGEVVILDPRSLSVTRRFATPGCSGPHGILISPDGATAYVACEDNSVLIALGLDSGSASAPHATGGTPDVIAFDPGLGGRLYVASESGVVSVFHVQGAVISQIGSGFAGPDAHSVAVDATTHTVYLPLDDLNGHPILREMVGSP